MRWRGCEFDVWTKIVLAFLAEAAGPTRYTRLKCDCVSRFERSDSSATPPDDSRRFVTENERFSNLELTDLAVLPIMYLYKFISLKYI